MKAITIKQPWAWAILCGGKDIENRSWYTHYRGPLLIHAGTSYKAGALLPPGVRPPDRGALDFGAIVGIVELEDVVQRSESPWFRGEYGFSLGNPRRFKTPVPCKGRLGLWTPTEPEMTLVREQLSRVG